MSHNQPPPGWGQSWQGGQPPYAGPPSQGGPPSYGPPSHGGPPSYGPPGQPPHPQGPGGQGPRRTNVGLIAALLSLVLVVVAVVVALTVTLAGDDAGDDSARESGDSATPTSEGTTSQSPDGTPSSPSPSGSPEDGPTSTSADGKATGSIYTYDIPPGWNDISKDMADQPTVDTVMGDGTGYYSSQQSLIVEIGATYGNDDAAGLKDTWVKTITGGSSTIKVVDLPETTIDGEPAIAVRLDHPSTGGIQVVQYGWLLIVQDRAVSIALTTSTATPDASLKIAKDALATWQWN